MSVEKTKYGTYRVRYRIAGRQLAKSFRRKIDAEQFEAKRKLGEVAASSQHRKKTFKNFSQEYLSQYAAVFKAGSSYEDDVSVLTKHLIPMFGHIKLSDITRKIV